MPTHDLEAILLEVLKHFLPIKRTISIDWVDLESVDNVDFLENNDHACIVMENGHAFIGIHPKHKRAPRYVLEYLVFHEVLHIEFGVEHSRLFNVAERLWPTYIKANDWLFRKHHGAKDAKAHDTDKVYKR
jgi:hypothetical protein